jgi:hypothetical protein
MTKDAQFTTASAAVAILTFDFSQSQSGLENPRRPDAGNAYEGNYDEL